MFTTNLYIVLYLVNFLLVFPVILLLYLFIFYTFALFVNNALINISNNNSPYVLKFNLLLLITIMVFYLYRQKQIGQEK